MTENGEDRTSLMVRAAAKWNSWTDQGMKGRLKKAAVSLTGGGVIVVGGALVTIAAAGIAAGLSAARMAKGAATGALDRRGETINQARNDSENIITNLQNSNYDQMPSTSILTEQFAAFARRKNTSNRVKTSVAVIAGALGAGALSSEWAQDVANGIGGSSGTDTVNAAPSPGESVVAPPANSVTSPEIGIADGDTTPGESGDAVELNVSGGDTVSDVFNDAPGSFAENWHDMTDAAANGIENGTIRMHTTADPNIFWYEAQINGLWTSDTEEVLEELTKSSKGKFKLAA